ncbi:F0F1 ATP synthase subunit B [Spiractinospora alimapuensis]|uniref:F0F1 ATP synthase subunit B n=1 Tax=Spiractinospora alimapuensis TaxID=2820884 RepID=UPI001EEBEB0B|nr:F0F1 ATP synthase subunit B [Spiractinospora alimapuensis]QVQ54235.1 F0F1 ATP synthase subunit B [Spiractinospora alimapuensis]
MALELASGGFEILRIDPVKALFGLIALALIYFFVARKFVPRITKVLDERQDEIEGGLERAKAAQAEAQETLERYQAQLAEARQEAAQLRDKAKEQGKAILAEMRDEAEAEKQRIVASAHTQIEADRQQAIVRLRAEIGQLSTELASRIVGETLQDQQAQERVVDRFLAELEEQSSDKAEVR